MRANLDSVGVVVATAGDCPHVRPALKGQPNSGSAGWAKMDIDLLAASVRPVFELRQFTVIELNGITFKQ